MFKKKTKNHSIYVGYSKLWWKLIVLYSQNLYLVDRRLNQQQTIVLSFLPIPPETVLDCSADAKLVVVPSTGTLDFCELSYNKFWIVLDAVEELTTDSKEYNEE